MISIQNRFIRLLLVSVVFGASMFAHATAKAAVPADPYGSVMWKTMGK